MPAERPLALFQSDTQSIAPVLHRPPANVASVGQQGASAREATSVTGRAEVAYEEAVARLHKRPADRKTWQDVEAARAELVASGAQPRESTESIRARENFWKDIWAFYLPQSGN